MLYAWIGEWELLCRAGECHEKVFANTVWRPGRRGLIAQDRFRVFEKPCFKIR